MTDKERMKTDVVFVDAVIRECAMLTIQHEVDQQKIEALERQVADQAASIASLEARPYAREDADDRRYMDAQLRKAIADLHYVMAGGDPCKVCTVKCAMGTGECKPVWRGEER